MQEAAVAAGQEGYEQRHCSTGIDRHRATEYLTHSHQGMGATVSNIHARPTPLPDQNPTRQ